MLWHLLSDILAPFFVFSQLAVITFVAILSYPSSVLSSSLVMTSGCLLFFLGRFILSSTTYTHDLDCKYREVTRIRDQVKIRSAHSPVYLSGVKFQSNSKDSRVLVIWLRYPIIAKFSNDLGVISVYLLLSYAKVFPKSFLNYLH